MSHLLDTFESCTFYFCCGCACKLLCSKQVVSHGIFSLISCFTKNQFTRCNKKYKTPSLKISHFIFHLYWKLSDYWSINLIHRTAEAKLLKGFPSLFLLIAWFSVFATAKLIIPGASELNRHTKFCYHPSSNENKVHKLLLLSLRLRKFC